VIVAAAGLFAWWRTRPRLSEAEQIEVVISRIEEGIEAKSPQQVLSQVSEEYSDTWGITYEKARLLSRRVLREPERIRVDILDYKGPTIQGDFADLELSVHASVLSGENPITEVEGNVELVLRKERKGWKVINAQGWQQWVEGAE